MKGIQYLYFVKGNQYNKMEDHWIVHPTKSVIDNFMKARVKFPSGKTEEEAISKFILAQRKVNYILSPHEARLYRHLLERGEPLLLSANSRLQSLRYQQASPSRTQPYSSNRICGCQAYKKLKQSLSDFEASYPLFGEKRPYAKRYI